MQTFNDIGYVKKVVAQVWIQTDFQWFTEISQLFFNIGLFLESKVLEF